MGLQRQISVDDPFLQRVLDGHAFLLMDGGMGTLIQAEGLNEVHEIPDLLNLSHPEKITAIHKRYVDAGSNCITTNTFSSNRIKLQGSGHSVAEVYEAAAACAKAAGAKLVSGDIGPIGTLLEPLGRLPFDEAYDIFKEQAIAAMNAGCNIILIETIGDLLEAKAAVLAAIENTTLPVFATMTFGEDGRTFLGTTPQIAATTLSALGASAVGVNCSLGPSELASSVANMAPFARDLLMAQPNAGLPKLKDDTTVYDVSPEEFAEAMKAILDCGATIVGGCCGTTPEYIRLLRTLIDEREPQKPDHEPAFVVTSGQDMCALPQDSHNIAIIGERINPTGKKKLRTALEQRDMDHLIGEAVAQQRAGADILDVNVGVPGINEEELLVQAVRALQSTCPLPLQIDSSDPQAIEAAARIYTGRPLINSVNGKTDSLATILPIAAHYGCGIVGLTLDENGIPPTAEERFAIAERIIDAAESAGIPREDIAIDCLVMSAATNQQEIPEILRAVKMVKERLKVRTVLGVSNISFGLPQRPLVNATFLAAAFDAGLDMPILNPLADSYTSTVAAWRVLNGQDAGCRTFIEIYAEQPAHKPESLPDISEKDDQLIDMILEGRAEPTAHIVEQLLETQEPLQIIDDIFIPVLDEVGRRYESGEIFLPQLMASAEAVKTGFDIIRSNSNSEIADESSRAAHKIILATVEGDIHDIGKNIVRMLLENYGYDVIDLGRDVPPSQIAAAVRETDARLVGLSALMTTTAPAMARTVKLLHDEFPDVAIIVGGAVVTPEYARSINANYYAKDAAASARIATKYFNRT